MSDTFREAFARLIFWGFYGLSTAMILFFLFILKIDLVEGASATISLFGQSGGRAQDVVVIVRAVQGGIAAFLYTWGMALAVFASGGLIPTVLEPGRIELLLSKPVARHHILLGRYLGSVLVVALNIAYLVARRLGSSSAGKPASGTPDSSGPSRRPCSSSPCCSASSCSSRCCSRAPRWR